MERWWHEAPVCVSSMCRFHQRSNALPLFYLSEAIEDARKVQIWDWASKFWCRRKGGGQSIGVNKRALRVESVGLMNHVADGLDALRSFGTILMSL